jgi:hypothetical protein
MKLKANLMGNTSTEPLMKTSTIMEQLTKNMIRFMKCIEVVTRNLAMPVAFIHMEVGTEDQLVPWSLRLK